MATRSRDCGPGRFIRLLGVTYELDDALALTTVSPGRHEVDLSDGWSIGPAVNGGLLLALAGRALELELGTAGHPDPVTVSAFYLSAAAAGPTVVQTETIRNGRTMATGEARIVQEHDGRTVERVRAVATYGDLDVLTGKAEIDAPPPDLPPVEECFGRDAAPPGAMDGFSFLDRIDLRLDPASALWAVGQPSGQGTMQGWLRMADARDPDPLMLLLTLDAMPPVTFDMGLSGWAPTMELTAHVRGRPAPGWLRVRTSTRTRAGGVFEEEAEVWDSTGRLVAQSRQLARMPDA